MIEVRDYFDKKSFSYLSDSNAGVWGLVKRRELRDFTSMLPNHNVKKILELGSGVGIYTRILKERFPDAQITCVDISPAMNQLNKIEGCKVVLGDISVYQAEEKYDLICAAGSLEFVSDLSGTFANLQKMLAHQGEMMFLVPNLDFFGISYKIFHATHGLAVRLFSREKFIRLSNRNSMDLVGYKKVWPLASIVKLKSK